MKSIYENNVKTMDMGQGTRVEIDFIDLLSENEGVLVGDSAKGYVRVLAECRKTETYPPRPFRVNAGAIHQYICIGDSKTKYLSELKSGDQIMVSDGQSERLITIGRLKLEKREFIRLQFDSGISATLQKADSVYLAGKESAVHLLDVDTNSNIQIFIDTGVARHKGEVIKEEITEK